HPERRISLLITHPFSLEQKGRVFPGLFSYFPELLQLVVLSPPAPAHQRTVAFAGVPTQYWRFPEHMFRALETRAGKLGAKWLTPTAMPLMTMAGAALEIRS
ncbi:MAG: hypothetical protein WBC62_08945, partial [Candidatus Macondimonas sp.]